MPSVSPAQHRWIGWLHSDPAARAKSGLSVAKVNEWLHSDRGKPWAHSGIAHRDDGGGMPSIGVAPSVQTMNPLNQNARSQYSQLSTEQLRELAARLGGSQQGQMVEQVLNQRNFMPQTDPSQQGLAAAPQAPQSPAGSTVAPSATPAARGGGIARRDAGGMMSPSEADPWWTRSAARQDSGYGQSGFLHSPIAGRTDHIVAEPLSGSHVIPADVVSGVGEGNSLAGAAIMDRVFRSGPIGTTLPRGRDGRGPPPPPRVPNAGASPVPHISSDGFAAGGAPEGDGSVVPALFAGGEYYVAPQDVARRGGWNGDPATKAAAIARGHKIIDKFIVDTRRKIIAEMKKLKGPVKT